MWEYLFHRHKPPLVPLNVNCNTILLAAFGRDRPEHWNGDPSRLAVQLGFGRSGSDGDFPSAERQMEGVSRSLCRALQAQGIEFAIFDAGGQFSNKADATHWLMPRCDSGSSFLLRKSQREGRMRALASSNWTVRSRRRMGRSQDVTVLSSDCGEHLSLHTELPFVRMVPGGRFVDFDCLKRCGQLFRDDATPKGLWLPSKSVQVADVVAQLLVEHRFSPEFKAFPALLLAHSLGLGHDEDLAFDAYLMLQTDVEYAEYEALRELLRALGEGALGGLSKRARTLLDHFIAAATHPLYRARLHLQRKAQVWQHEGHLERAAEALGRALRRIRRSRSR